MQQGPTTASPARSTRAGFGAWLHLDLSSVFHHHHRTCSISHTNTTLLTAAVVSSNDDLTHTVPHSAARGSETMQRPKTLTLDGADFCSGPTTRRHESIAASSNIGSSEPCLSPADAPSADASRHLPPKLPFPQERLQPDPAPQPITIDRHDDMPSDVAPGAPLHVSPQPFPALTTTSTTNTDPATAGMAVATLATISTTSFTAPALSTFVSASTSTAAPQRPHRGSTRSASVEQHALLGHELEHALELKLEHQHGAQVQAKSTPERSSMAIVGVEACSGARLGGGRSQLQATRACFQLSITSLGCFGRCFTIPWSSLPPRRTFMYPAVRLVRCVSPQPVELTPIRTPFTSSLSR